jgi:transcriptional regulator with XRE-family HTH domain
MKQAELARELGVSKAYISMVLRGKKKPSKRIAEKLPKAHLLPASEARRHDPKSCSSASSDTSPSTK